MKRSRKERRRIGRMMRKLKRVQDALRSREYTLQVVYGAMQIEHKSWSVMISN